MVVMFIWYVQEVAGLKEEDLPIENIDPPQLLVAQYPQ